MRANEFINEAAIGTILTKDLQIVVDDHALDRANTRGVSPTAVDYIIRKQLPKVLKKLQEVPVGERFWVYDWSTETSLGLRRISSNQMRFILKTVYASKPSRTPGIERIIQT